MWSDGAADLMSPATMDRRSVVRQDARYVIVHNDGEDDQEEDYAYLNDSFFDGEADIAAHGAFDGEQQNMAAIEDGDRQTDSGCRDLR